MGKSVARLYEQFQPEHYQLHLIPNREAMTFSGTVTIRGKKLGRPSQRLTFHQNGLKITQAKVVKHDKKGDQSIAISRINNQNKLHEVRLHSDNMVYPGEYTVTMDFEGDITKPMNGIYPCYFTHGGKEKQLIATQFESHYARDAFPCIDEPEAKATFQLTLTAPKGETVLSNTPAKSQKTDGNNVVTTFETTPRMSSYLLAFVFGELGYTEAKTKRGIAVRSYGTPDNAEHTQYSADAAAKILDFFEEYFDTPYPLPKLDMVALPDFSVGAMENWGLVTFREQAMIYNAKTSSIETKQMVALVTAHELSHQWFGNLVTMKWWDDLWLNESFANLMEYVAVDALHPEWNIFEQFVSHEAVAAKRRDSLADVQPVKIAVNHPDEINTVFDPSIVYAKGGNLLHMLMNHVGQEAFRSGLKDYFKQHAYGNTVANDLWEALGASSQQDIGSLMKNWLLEPGYPVIDTTWQPGDESVKLSQQRFLADPNSPADRSTIWQVPLATNTKLDQTVLTAQSDEIALQSGKQPLLLNHNGASYFVPHYTQAEHLKSITGAIADNQLGTIDRLLLLDNYTLLQRGGIAKTTELLDLVESYRDEHSESVWGLLSMALGEARRLTEGDDEADDKLSGLIRELIKPLWPKLSWEDKPEDTAQTLRLRGLVFSLAAGAKEQAVLDEGLERFRAFEKPGDLPPSTRGTVYFIAARYGSDADFAKLKKKHDEVLSAEDKEEIASGLTGAKDLERINSLLAMLKDGNVRRQDMTHWFAWLVRSRYGRQPTWQWMKENWTWITEQFGEDKTYNYFARYSASAFSRADELEDYTAFFDDKRDEIALTREIKLGEQDITARIAWRERNEASVREWLKNLNS